MQAINRKGIAYDSLPTNVNDTALKKQFPSGPFGRVWLLHSRLQINVCCFSYFLSSVHTNSVNTRSDSPFFIWRSKRLYSVERAWAIS